MRCKAMHRVKEKLKLGEVSNTCILSTWEAEAGRWVSSCQSACTERVTGTVVCSTPVSNNSWNAIHKCHRENAGKS